MVKDDGTSGKSISFSVHTFKYLKYLIFFSLIAIIVFLGFVLPKAFDYKNILQQNEQLLKERNQVSVILQDMDRIKQVNEIIRRSLSETAGSELDSIFKDDSDYQSLISPQHSMGLLDNYPTYLPIDGFVNARYTPKKGFFNSDHLGIDLSSIDDNEVNAAGRGYVLFSNWTYKYGNTVIIDHQNGYVSIYGHNERNLVQEGDKVNRGEKIAIMGNTGNSKGSHLHFEIWHDGEAIDPSVMISELLPDSTQR